MSIKNLILCGFPPLAVGGTGVGIWKLAPSNGDEEERNISVKARDGIEVGDDAKPLDETKDLIKEAGLNCGSATEETNCSIGKSSGLNVDIGGVKKEGLFPSESHNGNIKFRLLSDDSYSNNFRFTVIERPIKLENKSNTSDFIILDKYENYEVVKDGETGKVYLTRKLTKEQWIKKTLGLPGNCNIPTEKSVNTFDYSKETCTLSKDQIQNIKFDGKKDGGATTTDNVKLHIKKVSDTKTFPEGYKFTFHPLQEVVISESNKLIKDVWWDFRLKKSSEGTDEFVLERVWKNTEELLEAIGLSCGENGECTVKDGSLKVRVGTKYIRDGKRNTDGGTGVLKLLKNKSGHYEGLRFEVKEGEIEINNESNSTVKMQELEVFHVKKEDSNNSSFLLGRKHDLEEMIFFYLKLNNNGCTLPKEGKSTSCTVQKENLKNIKIHEGGGEQKATGTNSLFITVTTATEEEKSTYPFGYKFSLFPDGDITVGSTTLTANTSYNFKIKKEYVNNEPKLHLEKVN